MTTEYVVGQQHLNTYIAISGIIGAGKSTLATALARVLRCPAYFESVGENPILPKFYADQQRYAFILQVHLLNKRFAQQQQIIWSRLPAVQDRSIYEDRVFAKMLTDSGKMSTDEFNTYCELFDNMMHFMERPTLIVHLDVTPEESLRRIRLRERGCESGITLEYLQALHAGYETFLAEISRKIPVIRVDWAKWHDAEAVAAAIKLKMENVHNISSIKLE